MDIGSMCICMAIGALIVFASIGIGVCIDDNRRDKEQPDGDSDVRIYVLSRHRDRDCVRRNSQQFSEQEMSFVLHNVKRLTHGWEREIMDAIIEKIEKGDDDLK